MDKYLIIIHVDNDETIIFEYKDDDFILIENKQVLNEGWLKNVPSPYSARVERGVGANQELLHIHVFHKDKQIFAMNSDGSVHDGASGKIPNKISAWLNNNLPDWNWPGNKLVESREFNNYLSKIQQFYASYA